MEGDERLHDEAEVSLQVPGEDPGLDPVDAGISGLVRDVEGLGIGLGVWAVRSSWLKANPETARRYLRALVMAYDVLEKDPSPAITAVMQEMGIPEEWARAIFKEAGLPDRAPGEAEDARNQLEPIPVRGRRCKVDHRTLRKSLPRMLHRREATVPKLNQRSVREVSPTPCRQSRDSCLEFTHQNRGIGTAEAKGI